MMRKRKEKHEEPTYVKNSTRTPKKKSKTQHSIIHQHEERLNDFKKKDSKIQQLETKLKTLAKEKDKIAKDVAYKQVNMEFYDNLQSKLMGVDREIESINANISLIKSGEDEVQYLLESSPLLMKYVQLEGEESELLSQKTLHEEDAIKLGNIQEQKADIVDSYLTKFQKDYASFRHSYDRYHIICKSCEEPLETRDGFLVCPTCGQCTATIQHNTDLSFKELQDYDYRPQFTYEKQTHLEDWLRRFQSKENRVIPQEVLDKVMMEAKKERITNLNMLTEDKVKKYLKKIGLNEYYDNIIGIINRINGRPPFTLTQEIEYKIKSMFQQIQEPYERHKPKSRKNFLSYSYTLHKFFQILGLYEFSTYFPLLKSADKLRQQDDIFKKIVAEMASTDKSVNWKFYPSI
jgi:Zn finger protein HypA/HybF involved in hydrogenase expression